MSSIAVKTIRLHNNTQSEVKYIPSIYTHGGVNYDSIRDRTSIRIFDNKTKQICITLPNTITRPNQMTMMIGTTYRDNSKGVKTCKANIREAITYQGLYRYDSPLSLYKEDVIVKHDTPNTIHLESIPDRSKCYYIVTFGKDCMNLFQLARAEDNTYVAVWVATYSLNHMTQYIDMDLIREIFAFFRYRKTLDYLKFYTYHSQGMPLFKYPSQSSPIQVLP